MRKAAHIEAPPQLVADMFSNIRRWTAWMPGVRAVRVLSDEENVTVALIRQRWMGRDLEQKWRFESGDGWLSQQQLEGFPAKWENRWQFLAPPDGRGTTLMVNIDFDLGFLGRITPRAWAQERIDRMFDEVIDKAEARVRSILIGETMSTPIHMPDQQAILQVVQDDRGLIVRLGGRSYLLKEIEE
jgi:ribosome-associated toxin RatA of RatAB toxin-antitoxin module